MPKYVGGIGSLDPRLMIVGLTKEEILERLNKYKKILSNGCWEWTAKKDYGYGRIKINKKSYRVIRLICAIYHGLDISNKDQLALHKLPCSNESCWNPDHLYVGSHKDNQADRSRTITHCKHGHELTISNTYKHWNKRTKSYMRACKICRNNNQKRYYHA